MVVFDGGDGEGLELDESGGILVAEFEIQVKGFEGSECACGFIEPMLDGLNAERAGVKENAV